MSWSERMATGFTLSTLFSLVFVIMDHQWIKVETEVQIYYSGLWKVCLKLVCPDLVASAPNVNGAKTLLIMALFCGFVGASFMSITYRYSTTSATYRYLVPAVGSFIAAALVFLGLSIYTIRISTHGISRTSAASYQWPFYLAWTTCPFFILSGFLGLVAHQHMLMHGAVLSDKESRESVTSSIWSSSTSSSLFWEEGEKDMQIPRA
ncbi:Protein NKG7, partial [Ophiophagus hannah]